MIKRSMLPRVTSTALVLSLMTALTLSLSGCGGGGGGSNNNNNNGCIPAVVTPGSLALATITGVVDDSSGNPVNGALVTVLVSGGTNVTARTDCSGTFVATNVPLTATGFQVASPNPVAYYNYATYKGSLYDLSACTLPLPTLVAGTKNAPYTKIFMYLGGTNPPPPPPSGCPSP